MTNHALTLRVNSVFAYRMQVLARRRRLERQQRATLDYRSSGQFSTGKVGYGTRVRTTHRGASARSPSGARGLRGHPLYPIDTAPSYPSTLTRARRNLIRRTEPCALAGVVFLITVWVGAASAWNRSRPDTVSDS